MEKSGHNKLSKLVSGKPRLMETGGFTMRFESGKSERLFCKFLLKKAKTNHRQGYIKLSVQNHFLSWDGKADREIRQTHPLGDSRRLLVGSAEAGNSSPNQNNLCKTTKTKNKILSLKLPISKCLLFNFSSL